VILVDSRLAPGAFSALYCILFLALYARLFEMFPASHFGQDSSLLDLLVETLYKTLEALAFSKVYIRQTTHSFTGA
jgi:hypothetical protein